MNLAAFYHSGMYPEIYAPDRSEIFFPGRKWGHRNVYLGLFS